MKHKILISGVLVLAATAAHASFTVTLDQPNQTVFLPAVQKDVIFTGHVHKDVAGNFASIGSSPAALADFSNPLFFEVNDAAFFNFIADPVATDFFGELFRVNVLPTDTLGLHAFDQGSPKDHAGFLFGYTPFGTTGFPVDSGFVEYSVDIQAAPVPEPATMAVLGVGAFAALRRRRRA